MIVLFKLLRDLSAMSKIGKPQSVGLDEQLVTGSKYGTGSTASKEPEGSLSCNRNWFFSPLSCFRTVRPQACAALWFVVY